MPQKQSIAIAYSIAKKNKKKEVNEKLHPEHEPMDPVHPPQGDMEMHESMMHRHLAQAVMHKRKMAMMAAGGEFNEPEVAEPMDDEEMPLDHDDAHEDFLSHEGPDAGESMFDEEEDPAIKRKNRISQILSRAR